MQKKLSEQCVTSPFWRNYQELSSNAWPAKTCIFLHGWVLRVSEGVTKRANSVLPLWYTGRNVVEDVKAVERIYKRHELPVIFQVPDYCEPENLKEVLLSLRYNPLDETLVMAAQVKNVHAVITNEYTYRIEETGSNAWFHALAAFSYYSDTSLKGRKAIIERIPFLKSFCYAEKGNNVAGVGLGVVEREYLGIYSLVTHPEYRRRGIGQSMVNKMVYWAKSHSVTTVYLQVQGDNTGAISFYQKMGFQELYRYRYFVK